MQADLKQNLVNYAAEVTNDTRQKVGQNFCMRVKACFNGNECHIKHVDYKKFLWLSDTIQPIWLNISRALKAVNHPANYGGLQQLKLNYNFWYFLF